MAPPEGISADVAAAATTGDLSRKANGSRGYVTFLAGDGDYVKGVIGLAKGLRKVKSAYPLVVAVLPDVPEEHFRMLLAQGCIVRQIQPLDALHCLQPTRFARPYYIINYSKLRIWEFVEYDKMIYLDGDTQDTQVFENIDHLFELPDGYFYAVVDCVCATWERPCSERLPWPAAELGLEPPLYFNAGIFMFEPSHSTYASLITTLNVTPATAFAEQDFLNMFFKDVYKPLHPSYNLLPSMLWRHPQSVQLHTVKVVHYCVEGSKPWRYTGKEDNVDREDIKMLVKKWWDIYEDDSLDFKPDTDVLPAPNKVGGKLLAVLSETGGTAVDVQCLLEAPPAA